MNGKILSHNLSWRSLNQFDFSADMGGGEMVKSNRMMEFVLYQAIANSF